MMYDGETAVSVMLENFCATLSGFISAVQKEEINKMKDVASRLVTHQS